MLKKKKIITFLLQKFLFLWILFLRQQDFELSWWNSQTIFTIVLVVVCCNREINKDVLSVEQKLAGRNDDVELKSKMF